MGDDLQREFGRMEGRMQALETNQAAIMARFDRLEGKIDELRQDKARVQGAGWVTKAFFGLFGAGTATALIKATAFIR